MDSTKNETTNENKKLNTSWNNRMGIGSPEKNTTDTYERHMKIVPECISATDNEIPVKQYNLAILRNLLKFERAEGKLQITNKRVIFRAPGTSVKGRTTLQQEYAIDEIAGIETRNNYKFNFLYLIFACLIIFGAYTLIFKTGTIAEMMHPSHIKEARFRAIQATSDRQTAENRVPIAEAKLRPSEDAVNKAERDAREGILKTRRIERGRDWRGQTVYETQNYRDKSEESMKITQETLNKAMRDKQKVEEEISQAKAAVVKARDFETNEIRKKNNKENNWIALMTFLGLVLGVGGIIPFFFVYKKFGLKIFILCFSIFGFQLSLIASGAQIFKFLLFVSIVIMFI